MFYSFSASFCITFLTDVISISINRKIYLPEPFYLFVPLDSKVLLYFMFTYPLSHVYQFSVVLLPSSLHFE
jgi:hypothetical protein